MSDDLFTELIRTRFDRVEERLDDQGRDFRERFEEIKSAQADLAALVVARIDAAEERLRLHEGYHTLNEHKWGLARLANRHPFRFAALTVGALATLGMADSEFARWVVERLISLSAASRGSAVP